MPIFMDELNPPQIFYVMVSRVIFVVEVASGDPRGRSQPKEIFSSH